MIKSWTRRNGGEERRRVQGTEYDEEREQSCCEQSCCVSLPPLSWLSDRLLLDSAWDAFERVCRRSDDSADRYRSRSTYDDVHDDAPHLTIFSFSLLLTAAFFVPSARLVHLTIRFLLTCIILPGSYWFLLAYPTSCSSSVNPLCFGWQSTGKQFWLFSGSFEVFLLWSCFLSFRPNRLTRRFR